ncbi:hypothetical protein BU15DRAFT_66950 [Melanogaster broomeanus]|nr:hypothetical protein BU15DRAFT_66950 [Melanogaster broomeanus]
MSSPAQSESEPDADTDSSISTLLVIHLDTYTATSVSNGGKTKTKETKSTKVKEVTITLTASNYLDLLTTMLAKHGKDTYKVTEKKSYSFKYLLPPAKASVYSSYRGDAMDVDNAADFVDMAKKIIESKPSKVKVFIDMKEVEKLPLRAKTRVGNTDVDGSDEDHNEDDSTGDSNTGPGSDLERAIAHFRRLIIKQWGNEYDNSVTYLHPTGVDIPCTPLMIRDWAIAMVWTQSAEIEVHEGTATKLQPPNIQSFDLQKTAVALIPTRRLHTPAPAASNITPTPSSSEISALTSALLLQAAQGLSRDRNSPHTPSQTITSTPATSAAPTTQPQSPAIPTPSKLTRFLEYADTQLGVQHATTYEHALRQLGAGPDILAEMSDSDLSKAGLNPGDIICLKRGAMVWWNGPDAKRKRSMTLSESTQPPEKHLFQYEKRWGSDKGKARISGGPMRRREDGEEPDGDGVYYYKCGNRQEWVPIPQGWTFDEEGTSDDDNPFT